VIGGYAGAAVAKGRLAPSSVVNVPPWTKTLAFIVVSPFIGLLIGYS